MHARAIRSVYLQIYIYLQKYIQHITYINIFIYKPTTYTHTRTYTHKHTHIHTYTPENSQQTPPAGGSCPVLFNACQQMISLYIHTHVWASHTHSFCMYTYMNMSHKRFPVDSCACHSCFVLCMSHFIKYKSKNIDFY